MRISMCMLIALVLTQSVNAIELLVKASKVAMRPGETQMITVNCENKDKMPSSNETLTVKIKHGLSEEIILGKKQVELGGGEKKEFQFSWKPEKEFWGCFATAELAGVKDQTKKSRYAFMVSNNFPLASPAYGVSHSVGKATDEAIRERVQEFADCGVPLVEIYSWSPSLWGKGVNPEIKEWNAAQGGFAEGQRSLKTFIDKSHELGMLVYSYAQPCYRGKTGKEWCEKHPEDVLYRTPEHKLDKISDDKQFAAYLNPFNEKALNTGLDSYAEAFKEFKFDGIRWDGHPGVFYNPVSDWISRCNNSVSSFPYDSQGKPIILSEPDATNARVLEYVYRRLNKEIPNLYWGFNFCFGAPELGGGYNLQYPISFRKLVTGNLILQERHFHNHNGHPYIWTNQRWSTVIEDLAYSSELIHLFGGYLYRGDYSLGECEPFLKHAFSMHYASRARTFGVCPWYKFIPNGGKFPYDFVRFALRFNKFLYHPSLSRFNPQKPLQRISVSSQAPFPVKYENFCYDLFLDKKFRTIVHLINSPLTDQVNTKKTAQPPIATNTVVGVRHPLGMDKKTASYYVLSPEWPERIKKVEVDNSKAVANVEIPDFRYWAVVICEYSIGAGKQEYSSEGELFLPVLHRKGEL